MSRTCFGCEKVLGLLDAARDTRGAILLECFKNFRQEEEATSKKIIEEERQQWAGIICSTTSRLEGYVVVEYIDVINVQVILGVDSWVDLKGSFSSWIGGRAKSLEDELKQGFQLATEDMRREAFAVNSNAVVGLEYDGSMELGGEYGVNDKMMVVSATGTAVKVRKEQLSL